MVDLAAQPGHDPLELDEIEDEPDGIVEFAFSAGTDAVVVSVQPLAPVAVKCDEMRRGEDKVVLLDRHAELRPLVHGVFPQ